MLTVAEALNLIVNTVQSGPTIEIDIESALGMVLAEAIVSEVDSPPFDKALMDGYALRSADVAGLTTAELAVIDEITAGNVPTCEIGPGQAARIMTGAPIPAGTDMVIAVEETEFRPSSPSSKLGTVLVTTSRDALPGQFILRRGAAVSRGRRVLELGRVLRPQEIAALAELGQARVKVIQRPAVAVLATGDELVPSSASPGPGQIRNSNEPMLAAQIQQAGAIAVPLGIARDNREHLRERIAIGLKSDFLLLSGGVSAGKLDLVPSELAAAGVRQIFHKIQMKPGKPLWFGVLDRPGQKPCYVFGLPGNPVSSMVCCELFVKAALRRWSGLEPAIAQPISARLTSDISTDSNRPTYHPARIEWTTQGPQVTVVDWIGSSDLCATVDANSVVLLPAGNRDWKAGEFFDTFPWS